MDQPDRVRVVYRSIVKGRKLDVETPPQTDEELKNFILDELSVIKDRVSDNPGNLKPETVESDCERVEWLKKYVMGTADEELTEEVESRKNWKWPLGGIEGFATNSLSHVIKRANAKTQQDVWLEQGDLRELYGSELLDTEQYNLDKVLYAMIGRDDIKDMHVGGLFLLFERKPLPVGRSQAAYRQLISDTASELRTRLTDFATETEGRALDSHTGKGLDIIRFIIGATHYERKSVAAAVQRCLVYRDYETMWQCDDDVTTHVAYALQELYPPERV